MPRRPLVRDRRLVDEVASRYVRREIIALLVLSVVTAAAVALTPAAARAVRGYDFETRPHGMRRASGN